MPSMTRKEIAARLHAICDWNPACPAVGPLHAAETARDTLAAELSAIDEIVGKDVDGRTGEPVESSVLDRVIALKHAAEAEARHADELLAQLRRLKAERSEVAG